MAIIRIDTGKTPEERYLYRVGEIGELLRSKGIEYTESTFQNLMNGGSYLNADDPTHGKIAVLCNSLRRMGEVHRIRPVDIRIVKGKARMKADEKK